MGIDDKKNTNVHSAQDVGMHELVPKVDDGVMQSLFDACKEIAFMGHGFGSYHKQYSTVLKGIDRIGKMIIPPNKVLSGYTFITRPKLNLCTSNIRYDRIMSMLDSGADYNCLPFMIRALLDTNFAGRNKELVNPEINSYIDGRNPFITPLTNCLRATSGFPDFNIEVETTDGGFFGENVTFALGGDHLSGTFDINTTFRDIQGGVIFAIFWYWLRYIQLVTRGQLISYSEDIESRRLGYTSSIYRLLVDPTKRQVVYWSKATGCFPKNISVGTLFNQNDGELTLQSVNNHTVNWVANHIEYMDPAILLDFNALVMRFAQGITEGTPIPLTPETNFSGIPIVNVYSGNNELYFIDPEYKNGPKSLVARSHDLIRLKVANNKKFGSSKSIYKKALSQVTQTTINVYAVGSSVWQGIKDVLGFIF